MEELMNTDNLKAIIEEVATASDNLEKVIKSKKLIAAVDDFMRSLAKEANKEYELLRSNYPLASSYEYCGATLKNYSKRSTYIYPKEIVQLEAELKDKKALARKDGLAEKIENEINRNREFIFAVSL